MNRLVLILALLSFTTPAYGECDFSKDIKKNSNGSYTYSSECHIKVGKIVKENELREEQVVKLNKAIELKDLAITKSEERTQLWINTSDKLEGRLNTIEKMQDSNKIVWFVAGIGFTVLSVWAAGQIK